MSYLDRLRECKYTSPSGRSFSLIYDEVEKQAEKKAGVHELAGADGAIVQDLGRKARRYPLTVRIVGPDYDTVADAFADALDETYTPDKPGKLQHPRYGTLDVCPLSYIQREDLVGETMCAVFQIDFIHAPKLTTTTSAATAPAIQSAASLAASANAADKVATGAANVAKVKKTIKATAKKWTAGLNKITGITNELRTEITSLGATIESAVDTLISAPLDLCDSLTSLARLPAQLDAKVKDKAAQYSALVEETIKRMTGATSDEIPTTEAQASVASVSLVALGIAALESATAGTLASRDDALSVAASLAAEIAAIRAQLEALYSLYETPAELLDYLAQLLANVQAYLLEESFSLKVERRLTLDRDYFLPQLIRETRGPVDDMDAAIDEAIDLNHLGGDDILVIPRGTEYRYYA